MKNTISLHHFINQKLLLVGVGNVLKRDDGVGVYITNNLEQTDFIYPLTVEVSIENYIGKINQSNANLLILIDAMDLKKKPGYWNILPIQNISGFTTHTHNITLDKVAELFRHKTYVLGIQPENIQLGEGLTSRVKESADSIIQQIASLFPNKVFEKQIFRYK